MDERMMHSPYVRTRCASEAVIKMEAAALVGRVLLRIKIYVAGRRNHFARVRTYAGLWQRRQCAVSQ